MPTDWIRDDRLKGRVAIVTGAGRGIGKGIARVFARSGAAVVVATRTAKHGEEAVAEITDNGGQAMLVETELESKAEIERIVSETIAAYGGLDIAVHNAALARLDLLTDLTDDVLDRVYAVNVKAAVWLSQASIEPMRKRGGGRLLFTSSVTSRSAMRGATSYAISKAGLNGFIRNAAYELGQHKITVNGIEPGMIKTDALEKHQIDQKELEQMLTCIPLQRMGTPDEMGEAMLFLAADSGAYITGQTIVIDGGMLLPENGAFPLQGR